MRSRSGIVCVLAASLALFLPSTVPQASAQDQVREGSGTWALPVTASVLFLGSALLLSIRAWRRAPQTENPPERNFHRLPEEALVLPGRRGAR